MLKRFIIYGVIGWSIEIVWDRFAFPHFWGGYNNASLYKLVDVFYIWMCNFS